MPENKSWRDPIEVAKELEQELDNLKQDILFVPRTQSPAEVGTFVLGKLSEMDGIARAIERMRGEE